MNPGGQHGRLLSFGNGAHYCLGSPWPSMIGVTGPITVPIAFDPPPAD